MSYPPVQGYWRQGPTEWRTRPLPRGWKRIRARVLDRDGHRCRVVWDGAPCGATAQLDVHHICEDVGCPGCDDDAHLVTACRRCHRIITGQSAGRASGRARRRQAARSQRPEEKHPGLL